MLTSLAAGAAGALVWCASDFDRNTLGNETPYSHHAFELGFGVTRADGSEKPVCDELRALRALVDAVDFPSLARPRARAAIVCSDWVEESFPFSWEDKGGLRREPQRARPVRDSVGRLAHHEVVVAARPHHPAGARPDAVEAQRRQPQAMEGDRPAEVAHLDQR